MLVLWLNFDELNLEAAQFFSAIITRESGIIRFC